jgi:mannose-6-phosphate isomerase-like protein (cupin superfamily)
MSAERRYDSRRFQIEESTTQNGGAHTIFIETMPPGTTVPPHFHTRFAETFDLIRGSITVYTSTTPDLNVLGTSAKELEVGRPVTVEPQLYHTYRVGGTGDDDLATVRVVLTPGDPDFERLLKILNGLDGDGDLEGVGDSVVLMAVIMGLSDAHAIGPAKDLLDGVRAEKAEEIEALKTKLLQKYDTEEALQALLISS